MEPHWLTIARKDIGLKELPGAPTEPRIAAWLKKLGAWWKDDGTPWCGVAVAAWMQSAEIELPPHWYRAKGWLDWGRRLDFAAVGCVVIYERDGGGHVGLVVGRDKDRNIMTLGGNQGDMVSIKPFNPSRVLGYRWPFTSHEIPSYALALVTSDGKVSTQEA